MPRRLEGLVSGARVPATAVAAGAGLVHLMGLHSQDRHENGRRSVGPSDVAGAAARAVTPIWDRLATPAVSPPRFHPAMTESLPEPAQRWLNHVITPGTPLARAAIVEMHGHIRLGRWLPFRAVQVHAPPSGYIWAARVRLGPLWIAGYDRYSGATGEMRWRLLSRIPVMSATGRDIDRSAAGRAAIDAMLVPTAWLQDGVTWRDGGTGETAVAEWRVDDETLAVELTVGPDGALRSLTMPRWAKPTGYQWGEYLFGSTMEDEIDFEGIKLGTKMKGGYFYGTDEWDTPAGEFFRAEITHAAFL